MRIMITGSQGQLGQALQEVLVGHELTLKDRAGLDIADLAKVEEAVLSSRAELVINAAAYNFVDKAEIEPIAAFRGNALGPRNLAIATAHAGIPLFHVSTDYVFDGHKEEPYHEYDLPAPLGQYGVSKLAGEQAVRVHNPRHWIARTAWLYHTRGKNFVKTMLALAGAPEVRSVNDQYGSPTYAPHLAQAIARLMTTHAYGTYHLTGAGTASWYQLTERVYAELGIQKTIVSASRAEFRKQAARPRYSAMQTIQDPRIVLPRWEDGVKDFAARWKKEQAETGAAVRR